MSQRLQAEEHLRVIRSLMEKATIYRAISAPAALIGGLLAVIGATVLNFDPSPSRFLETWLVVLVLAALSNLAFLYRAARLRQERFFSPGMRLALVAMAPGLLSAAFLTIAFGRGSGVMWLPFFWMLCYALALLSTTHFAPRSIAILGWCFLSSALVLHFIPFPRWFGGDVGQSGFIKGCNHVMGVTFGLYHLIYAACTWPRKTQSATPPTVG